jgi:hypothetical protein
LKPWVDDGKVLAGEPIRPALRTAIENAHYMILVVGPEAVESEWVLRELQWGLRRESQLDRVFLIPVLLDPDSWYKLPKHFQDRRYLSCRNFTQWGVSSFAGELRMEILQLLSLEGLDAANPPVPPRSDAESRRNRRVRFLARSIADDQDHCTDASRLTLPRLREIVTALDRASRIQLLVLYELMEGRRKGDYDIDWAEAHLMLVEFDLGNNRFVEETKECSFQSFARLQKQFGLGSDQHVVRPVFLEALRRLDEDERRRLFSGVKIRHLQILR